MQEAKKIGRVIERTDKGEIRKDDHSAYNRYWAWPKGETIGTPHPFLSAARAALGIEPKGEKKVAAR